MPIKPRPRFSPLAEHLRETAGVITYEEAVERFGHHDLRICRRDRLVERVLPDVYAHGSCARNSSTRLVAAARWSEPAGALTGRAALWVWGAMKRPPQEITVHLPQALHLEHPRWIKVIRPTLPPDIVFRNGLRTVPAADALVQAWNESQGLEAIGLVVTAFGRNVVTASALADAIGRRARVRQRREFERVLGDLDGGVTSFLEHWARTRVFAPDAFPELRWQVPVVAASHLRNLDAVDPESKVALEFDGAEFHSGDDARLSDINRDAELASLGLTVIRLPYSSLIERPEWCRDVYVAARRARLADPT